MSNEWEEQKVRAEKAAALGDLTEAENVWLAALDETEKFDSTDPRLFVTIERLSALSLRQVRDPVRTTNASATPEPELSRLAGDMIDLVDLYYGRKRYSQAEILCKRLLSIYEHEMGPNHPDVGVIAQNLSAIYKELGLVEKSEQFNRRALKIRSQAIETSVDQKVACVTQVDASLCCQVCGRPILGSARPISGQKCLRCTGTIDSASLESDRLGEN
jgi:tetratricopeptide (TPR) repeat protein